MELNIEMKQQLGQLLAKPSSASQEHIPFLQQLIKTFPYYQPLHLLLAKASTESEDRQTAFTKAALYTNGNILHRIINEPQEVSIIAETNIITYKPFHINAIKIIKNDKTIDVEEFAPAVNEEIALEIPETVKAAEEETSASTSAIVADNFVVPEIENLEPLAGEIIKVYEHQELVAVVSEADEQEVFEEITEFIAPADVFVKEPTEENRTDAQIEEELIIESVAAADFFAFDRNFSTETTVEEETVVDQTPEVEEEPTIDTDSAQETVVSKYDDDKLPYTFLWWLAKTRKDHEQIFKPFASPAKASSQPLQQQYVENIFHIQAPLEPIGEEQTSTAIATKENLIIDNFIKNDPQIKALKPEQINNENKAKSSAEDSNDLVSETLAQIYIEQMLYHKAIDTYQKLSLKFPEKSGYFADLIQSLEKKI